MTQWEGIASKVFDIPGKKLIEEKLALNRLRSPTAWAGSWVRGKSDAIIVNEGTAAVFDWKTGKRKLTDQNKFYALLIFGFFPMVERVKAAFVWLKERKVDKEEFVRDELDQLWKPFEDRIERLEEAHELGMWPERPSGLCKAWCPITQCKHNGRR